MRRIKTLFLVSFIIGLCQTGLQAQQESHYSMFMLNPFAYNAGFAGMDYSLSATGVFRRQWLGLDFTPITQEVNVHTPLAAIGGGLGLSFANDQFGAERNTRFGVSYAYHLTVGKGTLSLGARANLAQRGLDGAQLRTPEGVFVPGGAFDPRDPILPVVNETGTTNTFDVGVYYKNEVFELGVGVNNITESVVQLSDLSLTNSRTFSANASANFELTYALNIQPVVFVQSDLTQTQMAVGLMGEYNEDFFGGVAYRGLNSDSQDALVFIGGIRISEKLKLGYAYDMTLSGLRQVSSGSHEILLNYNLNKRYVFSKPPNTIYHPRAF
ncbi:MAG: PorP/SprF family type IX secretion system membrane protein [Bacteroidota bacterium]